jgi:hypothetical protein
VVLSAIAIAIFSIVARDAFPTGLSGSPVFKREIALLNNLFFRGGGSS